MAKKFGGYAERTSPEAADLVLRKDVAGAATKKATGLEMRPPDVGRGGALVQLESRGTPEPRHRAER